MIPTNLKKYRLEKGLTLKEVGLEVGYAENTVSQWERGVTQPSIDTLRALASLYGISVSRLIGEEESQLFDFSTFERNGKTYSVYKELKKYDSDLSIFAIKEYLLFQKRLISYLNENKYQWEYSTGRELLFIPVEENNKNIDGILLEVPEHDFFEKEEPWFFISIGNEVDGYYTHENIDLSMQRLEDVVNEVGLNLRFARK